MEIDGFEPKKACLENPIKVSDLNSKGWFETRKEALY